MIRYTSNNNRTAATATGNNSEPPAAPPDTANPPAVPRKPRRLLGIREVMHKTSLSKANIYRKLENGTFPRPVQVSKNRIGWHESEFDEWIANLPRA